MERTWLCRKERAEKPNLDQFAPTGENSITSSVLTGGFRLALGRRETW